MIKPYSVTILNGTKYFSVNPAYSKLFEDLGIDPDSMFFKADPVSSGLHGDTSDEEPHFQFFENTIESIHENKYIVKRDGLPLLHGREINMKEVEDYFETLAVSLEYLLDYVDSNNKWAKENYKEVYLPNLESRIAEYKFRLNIS